MPLLRVREWLDEGVREGKEIEWSTCNPNRTTAIWCHCRGCAMLAVTVRLILRFF